MAQNLMFSFHACMCWWYITPLVLDLSYADVKLYMYTTCNIWEKIFTKKFIKLYCMFCVEIVLQSSLDITCRDCSPHNSKVVSFPL